MNHLRFLVISCSPREKGNTAILARHALAEAKAAGHATKILYLANYRYIPCRACDGCFDTGRCVVPDDAGLIYDQILDADRLVLAAPVYFMGICAQAKMLIDRAQQFWAAKYILKQKMIPDINDRPVRRGIFISCSGTTLPGVFEGTIQAVQAFFKMLEIELSSVMCYAGVDQAGDILQKPGALEEVAEATRRLCLP